MHKTHLDQELRDLREDITHIKNVIHQHKEAIEVNNSSLKIKELTLKMIEEKYDELSKES